MNLKSLSQNLLHLRVYRGKQDSESQVEKLGSDALEPRRVSIPRPGSEVQAMTPAYRHDAQETGG